MTLSPGKASIAWRYALAPACIAAAVLLRVSPLGPFFYPTEPFILGVLVAAWFGGVGPGVFAALLSAVTVPQLIALTQLPSTEYRLLWGLFDLPRFITLGLTGAAVGWGTSSLRRTQMALRERERELSKARDELETAVAERTAHLAASEDALRESQQRYERVMLASNPGIWDWDVVKDEFYVSPRFLEMGGLPPDTVFSGREDFMRRGPLHPEDREKWKQAVRELFASGGSRLSMELRALVNGETRWRRLEGICFRDPTGRVVRWTGSTTDITKRKQAEEALRRSEDRFALALAASNDGIWDWDLATDQQFFSERAQRIFGLEPGPTVRARSQWHALREFHPDDAPRRVAALERHLAGDTPLYEGEWRVRPASGNAGGEYRWIQSRGLCVRDPAGRPIRMVGSLTDIDGRKRMEAALRESEERYSLAMAASEEGHFDVNVDTDELFISERMNEIYGFAPGTTFGKRDEYLKEFRFYGNDAETYHGAIRAAMAKDGPERYEFEYRVLRPSGEIRWLRTRGKVTRDAEGRARRRTGVVADITEAKRAEEALLQSQERYALAVAGSDDGVWDVDFAAGRVFVSARARQLAGLPPGPETMQMDEYFATLPLHPEDVPRREAAMQAHLEGHTPAYVGEFRLRQPDGVYRWRRLRGLCLRDANGKPQRMAGSISDIDARRRAEEALRLSEERYALALEASEEGHFDNDLQTGEIFVSARVNEIYGFPRQARILNRIEFLKQIPFHPDDRHVLAELLKPDWEDPGGNLYELECRIVPRPGETRWIHSRAKVLRDAEGRPRRRIGVVADITPRKLAEEALRRSEQRYALAMEAAEAGHSDWNLETGEFYISPRLLEICGYPPGTRFADRAEWVRRFPFHPEDRLQWEAAVAAHFAGRDAKFRMEVRIIVRGETRWVAFTFVSTRDASGKPVRWTGSTTDITDRKRAEELLAGEKHLLEMMARGTPLSTVLDALCRSIEENLSGCLCGISLVDPTGTRLVNGAAPSLPRGYLQAIDDKAMDRDAGPCCMAAVLKEQVICADVAAETRWVEQGWGALALSHGLRSIWSTPIVSSANKALGTFAIYFTHPSSPTDEYLAIIERFSHVAAVAIEGSRAEEALRLSEKRYALAMEVAEEGHFDWNVQTDEIFASAQALRVIGLPENAQYRTRGEVMAQVRYHPDDWPRISAEWREALAGRGTDHEFEYRILRGEEPRTIRGRWKVFRDESGDALRVIGVVADITARKLAEEALREQTERLQLGQAAMRMIIMDWNVAEDRFTWSDSPEWLRGPMPASGRYPPFKDQVHPEDRDGFLATRRRALETLQVQTTEFRLVRTDGEVIWVLERKHAFAGADGKAVRMLAAMFDITDRKRAEEALRRSEAALQVSDERYALALEASAEGHFDSDLDKGEMFVSARLNEIYGFPRQAQIVKRIEFLNRIPFHPDDRHVLDEIIRPDWEDPKSVERLSLGDLVAHVPRDSYEFECRIVPRPGEIRWIHTRGKVMRDADGRARRRVGVVADITARKLAEEALRLSEQRYALAMEAAQDSHWDWNMVTGDYHVSPNSHQHWGFPKGTTVVTREDFFAVARWLPEDRELWMRATEELFAGTGDRVSMVVRAEVRGDIRWTQLKGVCVRDASGKPVRFSGSARDVTESKLAEARLRLSEERYALAMEASEEGHFDWNVQSDEIFASERLLKVLELPADVGYRTRSDMVSRMPFYPGDRERVAEVAREVLAGGALDHEFEYRLLRGQAEEPRWIRARWNIFRDAAGVAQRVIGVVSDITERKRAVDTLRESEARFRAIAELGSEAFWEQDENLRYISTGVQQDITGYSTDERIGKARWELSPEMVPLSGTWADHRAVLAARLPFRDFEYRRVRPDGEVGYYSSSGAPIFDEQGRFKGYHGVASDITVRKRVEEDLRSRQEMLYLAQKSARATAFEWKIGAGEGEGENRWSPDLEAMYGFKPGTYDGSFESWKKLVHPEDWPRVKEAILHAHRTGDVASEYRVVHPDGSVHWLQARGRMFFDAAGAPTRMVGFMQDITERKQAEEELRKLEQELRRAQRLEGMGTLAGGIAHDFNNILGAILGYGEMALRDAKKGTRLHRDLDSIMAAGERGRALVDRILAFSRSGVAERVPVHVEAVVREALDQLAAKLPANVTITPGLRAGRAAMLGDSTQVHQVVMNLVNNAVHAMPQGGMLRVSLDTVQIEASRAALIGKLSLGEHIVLKVTDAGTGIRPEVLERMFDPFFTTKEVGVGSGLGLSLVHGIVATVGGAIDVATELGKGSTFTVYFPRSGDAPAAKAADEHHPLPRGDGERVLVVDDEEPLVRLATETLESLGYAPVGFTSSVNALQEFGANPGRFDAILTDERMPEVTGSAIIREVRRINPSIPILLMTGFVGGAAALKARELGANDVLKKPLLARELATSLARVLHS